MDPIFTFLHVSDLHLGEPDRDTENAASDAATEPWLHHFRQFDGYLGHSAIALRQLTDFLDILKERENVDVVVTGDLTTVGGPYEFSLARQFLEDCFGDHRDADRPVRVGLNQGKAVWGSVIPGNHDHWPGRRARGPLDLVMWGAPTSDFRVMFPSLPYVRRQRVGVWELVFIGIDSDDGVKHTGVDRLLARGRFDQQLEKASELLKTVGSNEVRILLMHHSPCHEGLILGMPKAMRERLKKFVEDEEVRVILTGHVHEASGAVRDVKSRRKKWSLLEARCGTTTQRDFTDAAWAPRVLGPNSLIVHRLYDEGSHLDWACHVYVRQHDLGFVRDTKNRVRGTMGPVRVQVFP